MVGGQPDDVFDLPAGLVRLGARQVDLVDDRNDFEPALNGQIGIGERLRLDALRRIHEQQGALTGGQRAGHLVREIDVAGRVDQIEDVLVSVSGLVVQAYGMGLDGDAPLALEIHRVEHLRFHLARLKSPGELEEPIGKGRLSVIDMRDDGKIPDELLIQGAFIMTDGAAGAGQDGPCGAGTVCVEPMVRREPDGPSGAGWSVWSRDFSPG